uniref:LysR transcriptional regulator n=1 Tax=Haramonas pauciplastida TaxID=478668 RepID=UPI002115074C|nr:LysR transcriptional regulator [Haramonas pauciplastida]YP_010444166.1 LysR transcriptional regulator [Haramonas pauciplastida]UTE95046.1 LysR transcriptional regulator [Haramonas pauciplastida]UTE95052.1 LysR transcriptional regulator [Haramonas pauciplastida]
MNDLPFTLGQLKIFKAIIIEGSFKRAAHNLYLSQPTISLQVQNLEKKLNVNIFDRYKRLKLTKSGKILLRYANRILDLCEEINNQFTNTEREIFLIVGADYITGNFILPRLISLFKQRYPQISIILRIDSTRRIAWSIKNGEINFALMEKKTIPFELVNQFQFLPYLNDEVILIFPKVSLFSKLKSLLKDDIYSLKYVAFSGHSIIRQAIDNKLLLNQVDINRFHILMEFSSIEGIKNAVQAGLGVAFIYISTIFTERELGQFEFIKIEDIYLYQILSIVENRQSYKQTKKFFKIY